MIDKDQDIPGDLPDFEDDLDEVNPLDLPDDFTAAVARLSKDLREASERLSEREARYLVSGYYATQTERIRCAHRVRQLKKRGEPHTIVSWQGEQMEVLEGQLRAALDHWSRGHRYNRWLRSIVGIGPVISAGLISHFHAEHLTTAGHLWSFAGLNPSVEWKSGQVRPWNAKLKTLTWKAGQSFMKLQNHPKDIYGKVYATQKRRYVERNNTGGFAQNAAKALKERNWDKSKDAYLAYASGKLPPGHIDAMARRYAVKLFMAHFWEAAWRTDHPGEKPVLPYPIVHLGHVHVIEIPNKHLIPDYAE